MAEDKLLVETMGAQRLRGRSVAEAVRALESLEQFMLEQNKRGKADAYRHAAMLVRDTLSDDAKPAANPSHVYSHGGSAFSLRDVRTLDCYDHPEWGIEVSLRDHPNGPEWLNFDSQEARDAAFADICERWGQL